jgi:hypothetical protein
MLWCLNHNRIYIKSILIGISWLIYLGYTLALINNLTPNGCLSLYDLMYYNARSMQHNQSYYTIPISTTASKKIGQTSNLSQRFNLACNLFMAWVITYLIVIFQYIPLWAILIGGFKWACPLCLLNELAPHTSIAPFYFIWDSKWFSPQDHFWMVDRLHPGLTLNRAT